MTNVNSINNTIRDNFFVVGGTVEIGNDATSGAISIGTGAAARTTTIGNATGATSVVIDCGTGALNLGANAIARTTTLGNTTGASVLALRYGTGDFTLASASGTAISASDAGAVQYPLQPCFAAYVSTTITDVTGDGSFYGPIIFDATSFNVGADYSTSTGNFTAPVTGKYLFTCAVDFSCDSSHTSMQCSFLATSREHRFSTFNPGVMPRADNGSVTLCGSCLADLTAADTMHIMFYVSGGSKTVDVQGSAGYTICFFEGWLIG